MRRDHERILARHRADFFQCVEIFSPCVKIVDKHMACFFGGDLHAGDQRDAQSSGVFCKPFRPDVKIVACNPKNLVAERGRSGDQLLGSVSADPGVFGIKTAVRMQFRLQPAFLGISTAIQDRFLPNIF